MTFELEKIKRYGKKIMYCAGEHCWLLAVVLLLIALLTVGVVFLQYVYPIFIENQGISAESVKINQTVYEQIKSQLENRRQNLQDVLNENHQDPFR